MMINLLLVDAPVLPSPPGTPGGEGLGVRGDSLPRVCIAPLRGNLHPLTPGLSPPEYWGRGGKCVGSIVWALLLIVFAAGCRHASHDAPSEPLVASPRWLLPSDTGRQVGYHVGGGAVAPRGEPRHDEEGTWGWDYQGWLLRRRVIHNWWHGQRYQGGTGAYKTDGPHFYHHDAKMRE